MPVDATPHRKRKVSSGKPLPANPCESSNHVRPAGRPADDLVGEALFAGEFGTRDTLAYIEEIGRLGLWAWDLDDDAMLWSRGMHAILDYAPGEVEPSHDLIVALTHPDDRLPPGELERMLRDGVSVSREFRLVRRNGRVRWIAQRGETLLDASGRPSRAVGVMMDVTEKADAKHVAKAMEERLSALTRASGAVVWTTDAEGGGGALDGFGPSPAAAEPDRAPRASMTIHSDDRAELRRQWSRARIEISPLSMECRVQENAGVERWIQLGAAPIVESGGRIREWIWVRFDIEDRRRGPLLQEALPDPANPPSMTGAQLRAARGCLNWSVRDLSESSGVSPSVIRRLEEFDAAPSTRVACMDDLRRSLQRAGIEFLFPSSGKPGIRPR